MYAIFTDMDVSQPVLDLMKSNKGTFLFFLQLRQSLNPSFYFSSLVRAKSNPLLDQNSTEQRGFLAQ